MHVKPNAMHVQALVLAWKLKDEERQNEHEQKEKNEFLKEVRIDLDSQILVFNCYFHWKTYL